MCNTVLIALVIIWVTYFKSYVFEIQFMSLRVPNLLNAVSELHIGKFPAIYSNIKLIISMLDNENSLKIVNTVIQVFQVILHR